MPINNLIHPFCSYTPRPRLFLHLIVIASIIIILYLSPLFSPLIFDQPVSKLIKYRLRTQNSSAFKFFQLRDPVKLITLCESIPTIECLAYLSQNQSDYLQPLSGKKMKKFEKNYCTKTKKMLYHTFWSDSRRLDHPFLQLHIRSFLYTQNRRCSHLIVWTLPSLDPKIKQIYDRLYIPHVEFRSLMEVAYELLDVGTPIGPLWYRAPFRWLTLRRGIVGDAVRFVLLKKYGGIYVDVDVIFLRDLQPLFMIEFAYRWSMLNGFNTAVLQVFPQSNTTKIIMDQALQTKSPYTFYPTYIHKYALPKTFYRLPCALFDPLWLAIDGVDPKSDQAWKSGGNYSNGFKNSFSRHSGISRQGRNVFNGAFAFHWHSASLSTTFESGSYMQQWNDFLDAELHNKSGSSILIA